MRRSQSGAVLNDPRMHVKLVSIVDVVRPGRCGDAGRRAATARAHSYVADIEPLLKEIIRDQGRTARAVATELTRRAVRNLVVA